MGWHILVGLGSIAIGSLLCDASEISGTDFETQVLPILTKAGCNTGACHGSALGRGGFALSLWGEDPRRDFERLVLEFEGRRVNLAQPEKSLILRKPTERIFHEGGPRLSEGGLAYQILLDWIRAGAPRGPTRSLLDLNITPSDPTLDATGESFRIRVQARYSDGTEEDVTRWAVFTPVDESALSCTPLGEVKALRTGRHAVLVRFLERLECVTVTIPMSDKPPPRSRPLANLIDSEINQTLDELGLPHASRCEDLTFLRRACLDLNGRLPEIEEIEEFRHDPDPGKRSKLIQKLLDRPEFVDLWASRWGDLLRVDSKRLGEEGARAFHGWIREQVAENTPIDRMARELIVALGDARTYGPANFQRVPADARSQAEYVSQVFLGVRIQCANCHNHPLDSWTQDDYHGLAAVFAKVRRGDTVELIERGNVIHPKTGTPARPRPPGVEFLDESEADPRESLAEWLVDPANPFFARAAVNRVWANLMGRGLVEPLDDQRASNPATHPELLDTLAEDFQAQGFDLRHTIRLIMESEAYQRDSRWLEDPIEDDRFYSRFLVRPLPPHVLVDAVSTVTGVAEPLGNQPLGTPARALGDSRIASEPLDLLGRCDRSTDCGTTPEPGGSLPMALHAIQGPWLNAKIEHPRGRLHHSIQSGATNAKIVSTFYLLALSRSPSDEEVEYWRARLDLVEGVERRAVLEDFLWGLLNSTEFLTNH